MNILEDKNVFCTGGAGTLGKAIAERRKKEGWTGKFTVYSTDSHKHGEMKKMYPDINFIQGDIRNPETLYNGMIGHDIVLHLAAVKVIPDSEYWTMDTIDVNVNGSVNVLVQSIAAGIEHVLGVSTDKVAHTANAYGATKYLMEKVFSEYSRVASGSGTEFHLVRYGNVLESTGSVIEVWRNSGGVIKVTDPRMTRFWLSPQQAVDMVIKSLELPSGQIYIPKMKSLSIGKLADYVLGDDFKVQEIPLRPGEKQHETLLTLEECRHAIQINGDHFVLHPTTSDFHNPYAILNKPYTSDIAEELTKDELLELLRNE